MNDLRFSASPPRCTCSADTIVPWMTSNSTPAAITGAASDAAFCGETRTETVPPPAFSVPIASPSRSIDTGAEYASCSIRISSSGSASSSAAPTISSMTDCGSACRAHNPSAFEHPEATESSDLDGHGGRHDRVGGVRHQRDVEPVRVDLPGG